LLHASDSFAAVIARIVREPRLYPTADELGGLNVQVYGAGDELGWHFDRGGAPYTFHSIPVPVASSAIM
jgi:hypothetical protein